MNIPEPIIALLIVFVPLATTGIYIIFRDQRAANAATAAAREKDRRLNATARLMIQ